LIGIRDCEGFALQLYSSILRHCGSWGIHPFLMLPLFMFAFLFPFDYIIRHFQVPRILGLFYLVSYILYLPRNQESYVFLVTE
jgi:hypothetical protein